MPAATVQGCSVALRVRHVADGRSISFSLEKKTSSCSPNVLIPFDARGFHEAVSVDDFCLTISSNDQDPFTIRREFQVKNRVAFAGRYGSKRKA